MQVIVLVAFVVILGFGSTGQTVVEPLSWPWLVGAIAAYWAVTALLAGATARAGLRRLMQAGMPLDRVLRRHHRGQLATQMWMLIGLAALLAAGVLAWPGWLAALPLVHEVAAMGVFLVACLLYWRIGYRFDRAVRWQVEQDLMLAGLPVRAGWTPAQHVIFNLRHHFLFVAIPISLIILAGDLIDLLGPRFIPVMYEPHASMGLRLAAVGLVFLFSPLLLTRVWKTRPLPAGELRTRLERLCKRIGLHYRKILIWDTGGVIVNAGVMGLHRAVRYILLSDALIEQMDDRQIVSVFGHEAGHVVHHHVSYFLLFTIGAMTACTSIVGLVDLTLRPGPLTNELLLFAQIVLVWGLGFGWLSRRMERQADVFGAWCAGLEMHDGDADNGDGAELALGAPTFVGALENVARLNGMPRNARNWRHGSMLSRVMFLMDWANGGLTRRQFDRQIGRLKLATWALLVAGVTALALLWPSLSGME